MCTRITRGSSLKMHVLTSVSKNSGPRICILINLLTFKTQTHATTGKQVSEGPPLGHAEVEPSDNMFPLHRRPSLLSAHLPQGRRPTPLIPPTQGRLWHRKDSGKAHSHPSPKSRGQCPDRTKNIFKNMGNNTAPVPSDSQTQRTHLRLPP